MGQRLRLATADVDPGEPVAARRDEGGRRIDGGDPVGTEPVDEDARERAGAAAHVDRPLTGRDLQPVGEVGSERSGVAAHEAVVGVTCHLEGHVTRRYSAS